MTTWNTASDSTVGDRQLNCGECAVHLSDGALVFLQNNPATANPNKISLMLAANHTSTPVFVASISSDNFDLPGLSQALALVVDGSDNLYVVGQDAGSDPDTFGLQAFQKGSGHVWSAQPYINPSPSATEGNNLGGFSAVWCNTGGGTKGAGHIIAICDDAAGNDYATIFDAGKVLAGTQSGSVTKCTQNPAFLGGSAAAASGSNLDISADGFGATSGIAVSATTTTSVTVGAWGVTQGGALTTGGGLVHTATTSTLSGTTQTLAVRQSSNLWVVFYRSSGTAAQLTAQTYSSSALLGTLSALGTPSNFPAQGASLSWAVCAGPTSPVSQVWVFGFSSQASHLDDLLRLPVVVTTPSTPSAGSVVTDNAAVSGGGASADMTTLRAVKQPVDALHIDWQAYKSTSTYALYGYYTALPTSPNVPTLTSPTSGSIVALSGGNLSLSWLFTSNVIGDAQTLAYVRRQLSGSGYQWWNGASWTAQQAGPTGGNETTVSGLTTAQTVSTSTWVAADVYSYSVQTVGSTGILSGYAPAVTFTIANSAPSAPTFTATYSAATNTTTLVLTGNASGPTGSIEYSDDSGVTWTFIRGATSVTCYAGAATFYDLEAPAGATRQYRARVWTGYPTSYSAYTTATATPAITTFWLVDPVGGTSITVHIHQGTLQTTFPQQSTDHQPLGSAAALVVADVVGLEDGAATFWTQSTADEAALMALLNAADKVLQLQSPDGRSWYLRVNVSRPTDVPYIVQSGSYRQHAVSWRGQDRP